MKQRLAVFLNIPIWKGSLDAVVDRIFEIEAKNNSCHVVTINAEMLLCAAKFEPVAQAIFGAQMWVADSMTARWFYARAGQRAGRIPGVDLAEKLVTRAAQKKMPIIILGGATAQVRTRATEFVLRRGATVAFAESGPIISYGESLPIGALDEIAKKISAGGSALVLVGFGHGKQERAIEYLMQQVALPCIFVGVGGSLDMWAGEFPRAPKPLRFLGLEWLWRLILQPSRIHRIIQAVFVFPFSVLFNL